MRNHSPGDQQVKVSIVRQGSLPRLLEVSGEISSTRKGVVNAQQTGIVERVSCRVGERVTEGQVVLWLRPGRTLSDVHQQEANLLSAQAEVARQRIEVEYTRKQNLSGVTQARESLHQAEIGISQAKTQLSADLSDRDRKKELLAQKAIAQFDYEQAVLKVKISQDMLDTATSKTAAARNSLLLARQGEAQIRLQQAELGKAEAGVAQAQAALDSARIDLSATVVYAPMSGVVVDRQVEPGQSVGPGGPALLTLVNNQSSQIEVVVDSRFSRLLRPGVVARVTSSLNPGEHFQARLQQVIPSGDAKTNTFRAHFKPVDMPADMLNGTSVRLSLSLETFHGILVPLAAVRGSSIGKPWVWVIQKEAAHRVSILVEYQDDSTALLKKGLKDGEAVVITGGEDLVEGGKVQVLEVREPYKASDRP